MRALLLAALLALATPAFAPPTMAVEPSEMLEDPAKEARAREVSKGLRCLVCQNESIDDSNAELARDLRIIVRDRIRAGDSNEQVLEFVVARYGDYVLLNPPFKASTYVLWFGPLLFALAGLAGVLVYFRRRKAEAPAAPEAKPLSDEERKALDKLLKDHS